MTTPITTLQNIIDAMEQDPALRSQIRQHILTEALLQLPAVVGQPDPGEPPLTQQVRRIESRIGNVAATQYKGRAAHRAISRVRTLGIERARIVLAPGESQPVFQDAMAEAVEHGLITQEQLDDLTATDIILRGGNRRYVVIEASLEPDQDDLERALRRARVLARATGQDTMPAVAAPELPDGCTSRPTAWESQYLKFQLEQRVASEHLTSPGLGNRRQCGNYAAKTGAPLNPGRRGVPQNTSGNSPPTSKAPGEPR